MIFLHKERENDELIYIIQFLRITNNKYNMCRIFSVLIFSEPLYNVGVMVGVSVTVGSNVSVGVWVAVGMAILIVT